MVKHHVSLRVIRENHVRLFIAICAH